jgi:hypothetical protein
MGEFLLLRWWNRVDLGVDVCQRLGDDNVTMFCIRIWRSVRDGGRVWSVIDDNRMWD